MKLVAPLIVLALAGCSGPPLSDRQKGEVTDIASDVASAEVQDSDRISDLESRIEELEARLGE